MIFFIFAVFMVLLLVASAWWYLTIPRNLPTGPIGLPFFGTMFSTWSASNLHNKLYDWTKIYGPIYKFYVADKLVVVLGNWNLIQEALVKQGDVYAGRPQFAALSPKDFKPGSGLVNSEGELWKVQRRFALSTLRDFGFGRPIIEPSIKDETEYLIEALEAQNANPFDPAPFLNNAVSNVICSLVFGKRFQYEDENFHKLLRLLRARLTETDVSVLTPFIISPTMAKLLLLLPQVRNFMNQGGHIAKFAHKEISEALQGFDAHRDEPSNYIQAFYKAQLDHKDSWTFTDDQLLTSVSNLFVAGTDTTATTLRWAIFFLSHYPEWQERVHAEIKAQLGDSVPNFADRAKLPLTEAVIMETQRMANLTPLGVMRRTLAANKLVGYDIPEDTVIVPLLTSVLRDPDVYPNPEKFDPNRFLIAQKNGGKGPEMTHFIPFLAGKRICLGESLARMELFLFFTALFSNLKFSFPQNEAPPAKDGEKVSFIRGPPRFNICAQRRLN